MTPTTQHIDECPHGSRIDGLEECIRSMNSRILGMDTAIRGDGVGNRGLVAKVDSLCEWRDDVESEKKNKRAEFGVVRVGVVTAVVIAILGMVGTAVVAGAKVLGWHIVDGGK